jgi:hypothetical protein
MAFMALALLAILPISSAARENVADGRIVAIGDLHGDFDAWREIARAARIINSKGKWIGGKTTLVQMGDVTDRGPDSLKIIRDLQRLEKQAAKRGGEVIVLIGNHEAMNVIGDLRYVDPGEYQAFVDRRSEARREAAWQANRERYEAALAALDPPVCPEEARARWFAQTPLGFIEHRYAWQVGGELWEWAAQRPAVVKLGSNLFVHGGLSVERANEPLATINARIAGALAQGAEIDRSALEDPLGPLWYRGNIIRDAAEAAQIPNGNEPDPADGAISIEAEGDTEAHVEMQPPRMSIAEELETLLELHGANRLIVAHTPSLEGIVTSENARLIRVDTGISRYYGGPASFLEILGDRLIAYQRGPDGNWRARDLAASSNSPMQ